MSDVLRPCLLDPAHEAAAIRDRSATAFRELHALSLGAGDFAIALSAVKTLRSRCEHLCHELELRCIQPEPVSNDLVEYVESVLTPTGER